MCIYYLKFRSEPLFENKKKYPSDRKDNLLEQEERVGEHISELVEGNKEACSVGLSAE
jgi:hypothetical protein